MRNATFVLAAAAIFGAFVGKHDVLEPDVSAGQYLGSNACVSCHPAQAEAWRRSHHARAQEKIQGLTASIPPAGREGDNFVITLEGASGNSEKFRAARAIGVDPLVQWLIPATKGRWQATALAFDVHRREWFDTFAGDERAPDEWGHWTQRGMTWNFQCAACHVSRFEKRYDITADAYDSRWLEEQVGCEECHGPGGSHVAARARSPGQPPPAPQAPVWTGPRPPDPKIEMCARCHARRTQLAEGFPSHFGAPPRFLDHFVPVLPDDQTYFADGQIKDEVYEWASFLQSRMYAVGVGCKNCHDPHTGKTWREGNDLCLQCHSPTLAAPNHTLHPTGSPGAVCVECHMPRTTFMVRHPRRDHSMSKPLPALTLRLGIPNACNRCHENESAAWAQEVFEAHYGKKARPALARAESVAAARAGRDQAIFPLLTLLADAATPAVWRASAANLLAPWSGRPVVASALAAALQDPQPLVRLGAVRAARHRNPSLRELIDERLEDEVRSVRVQAVQVLLEAGAQNDGHSWQQALAEWRAVQELNADHPSGRHALAALATSKGDSQAAERHLRLALSMDSRALPIRTDLASLLVGTGRLAEALALLEEGLTFAANDPTLHFQLGLGRAEQGDLEGAIREFEKATELDPDYPRGFLNLGIAYLKVVRADHARRALEEAVRRDPNSEDAQRALASSRSRP